MNRTGKNYKLPPSFSDDIDKKINTLEKKALMIKKLHRVMNTIKANGLYSDNEMQRDLDNMDKLKCSDHEKRILAKCWAFRKKANKTLMKDTERLLNEIEKVL